MTLLDIEGGLEHAATLEGHGLTNVDHLLGQGGTVAGRKALAQKSGISEKLLLEWVNHADLCRINGVGSEYADLLEEAGGRQRARTRNTKRRQARRGAC